MSGTAPDPRQGEIFAQDRSRSLESASCAQCGGALSGRQTKFCSDACNTRWWDAQHARINRGPAGPREGTIRDAILGYLADGEWRTKAEIAFAVRAHEHSVGSRLSELRRKGLRIESDAKNGNATRAHRFRLVLG